MPNGVRRIVITLPFGVIADIPKAKAICRKYNPPATEGSLL